MEYSDSEDMASQQLLAEVQASAKKAMRPPVSSAAQGAALLNAARVAADPPSSPSHIPATIEQGGTASLKGGRAKGGGKLKRPSLLHTDLAKRPKLNLARRGDPFEIQSSPEKAPAKPPAKAKQKASKRSKKPVEDDVMQDPEAASPPPDLESVADAASPTFVETEQQEHVALRIPPFTGESEIPARPRTRKWKPADEDVKSAKRSKSPRVETAAEVQVEAAKDPSESSHRTQRDEPVKRNAGRRAKTPKTATEDATPSEGKEGDEDREQIMSNGQGKAPEVIASDQQHESEEEPPQSAQKPPEQVLESTPPRKPKHRKMRQLNAQIVANGLDIPSDKEDPVNQPAERDRGPPSPDIPRLREKRPRPSKALLDRYGKLPRDHNLRNCEPAHEPAPEPMSAGEAELPRPTQRGGRVTRSSKKAANGIEASQVENEPAESSAQVRQPPSKAKSRAVAMVTRSKAVPTPDASAAAPDASSAAPDPNSTALNANPTATNASSTTPIASAAPNASSAAPDTSSGAPEPSHQDEDDSEASDESEELSDLDELSETASANADGDSGTGIEADNQPDVTGQQEEGQQEAGQPEDDDPRSDLDIVFEFLNSDERSGHCQTAEAIAIKRACKLAREVFEDSETKVEEILTTTRNLQQLLARYGRDADATYQRKLKSDAYAYLFRDLVRHLEGLHDWLRQEYGDIDSSFDALRVIVPFMTSIISLKDHVADWKVTLSNRYQGDGFIKEVVSDVITPLRKIEATSRATLRAMRETAKQERAYEDAVRAVREREEAEQRKYQFEDLKRKKQISWIDLHVCRLQVEHDHRRQHALAMNRKYFDEQMERYVNDMDANGVQFERVDVFKKRVAPPPRPSAFLDQKEWSDEQLSALIEGLTEFSGQSVFHNIFRKYCAYGQPLRQFGVPEITAKAAEVRSQLLTTYQENAWGEVPEWISNIPILP